jgi:transposase-like protein
MKAKRKRHDPDFKARVALEALKGIKTVQQIAKEYDVHPVQVSDWKKKLSAQAGSVFDTGKVRCEVDPENRASSASLWLIVFLQSPIPPPTPCQSNQRQSNTCQEVHFEP